jgi:hypothetical protein
MTNLAAYCNGFLRSHRGCYVAAIAHAEANITLDVDGADFWASVVRALHSGIPANAR